MIRVRFIPLLLVPLTGLDAQGAIARTPLPRKQPMVGACAAIANVPSVLTSSPEGMALLRFKKELEGVATVFVQRDSALRGEARRMVEVQRGVDSLMQAFVRVRTADSAFTPSHTYSYSLRKGDSTMVFNGKVVEGRPWMAMEDAIKAIRPDVEVTLRSVEPRMHAFGNARLLTAASATGYMGVNLSGSQIRMVTDSGIFTAHCDYPMIEAVDVGSPARQADLRAGDTIVAYNSRDVVAQSINYPQLLVPGKVVRVRVRRDGKPRDVAVTVAERPQESTENVMRWYAPMPAGGMISPAPVRGGMARTVPPGAATMAPTPRIVGANASTLFGAQLKAVDEDFARRLGSEPGILVMDVTSGTPAAEAGLRPGETILAVNGVPIKELVMLQRVVRASSASEVKLTVTAKDTPARIVTVRW